VAVNICKLVRAFFLNYFVVAGKFNRDSAGLRACILGAIFFLVAE
jgi:hypothetical protein